MNEHVAPTVVGFNEAVASFAVKEFHHARLRHRETPFPPTAPPPAPRTAARPDIHNRGKRQPRTASVTPPAPTGGGTSLPMWELHTNCGAVERGYGAAATWRTAGKPVEPKATFACAAQNRAQSR